ncbi:hypothetical protein [Cupriavidus sp. Marseille-Q8015]
MITIQPFRTRRIDARMQELSIGDEIALCDMPERFHEKSLTEFLVRAIETANTPSEKHEADPRRWTVSERLFALAHYCLHVRADGPNWQVTETSRLADYLDTSRELADAPLTFEALGDTWHLQPLIGAAAEAIEANQLEPQELKEHTYWLFACMAARLTRPKDAVVDPITDSAAYMEWLRARINDLRSLSGSDFEKLHAAYAEAHERSTHFLRTWHDAEGVIVLPKEAGGIAPPARFRVLGAVGPFALRASGKSK